MASVVRQRRLVNPGRRRRRKRSNKGMSLLQKLHFGSKAQRSAAAARLKNPRRRKRVARRKNRSVRRRRRNVSNIVTIRRRNPRRRRRSRRNYGTREGRSWSSYTKSTKKRKRNPRRRRNSRKVVIVNKGGKMARRRRARKSNRSYRRRRNYGRVRNHRRRRRSNPGVTRHHRRRRYNRGRRRMSNRGGHQRRRNPGFMTGTAGRIVGVIGGIAVTRLFYGFVPSTFATGVLGYLSIGVIAFAQGKLVGKVSKNSAMGEDFLVGGFAYLVAKMLNDFFPTIGSYTGISGMGLIGGSSFYNPQVNAPGQGMGQFLVPAAVTSAIGMAAPAPQQSLGRLRRTGRLM